MSLAYATIKEELEGYSSTSELIGKIGAILELDAIFTGLASTGKAKTLLPDTQVLQDIHTTLEASVDVLATKVTDADKPLEETYLLLDVYNRCLANKRNLANYLDLLHPFKERNHTEQLSNVASESKNTVTQLQILSTLED